MAAVVSQANTRKPATVRRDPAARRVDRSVLAGGIKNADPQKHYVWVYKASPDGSGLGYYENMGYEVELTRPGGPRSAVQRKGSADGVPIEFMGNVLMSIDKAEKAAMDEDGYSDMNALMDRILDKSAVGQDELRGISGTRGRDNSPVISIENKTGPLQTELEQ